MASEITFVSDADIGFFSAVSLPNLSQALLENFLDSDHGEDDSEQEWSEYSNLSSGEDSSDPSEMSEDELPRRGQKTARSKKVPKATNIEGTGSSKEERKKGSGKYLSTVDVK